MQQTCADSIDKKVIYNLHGCTGWEEKRDMKYLVQSIAQDTRLNSLTSILNDSAFATRNGGKCSYLHLSGFPVLLTFRKSYLALWRVNWPLQKKLTGMVQISLGLLYINICIWTSKPNM